LAVFGVGATVVGIVSLIVQVNKLDRFSLKYFFIGLPYSRHSFSFTSYEWAK
jgi:hypothetical protein